MLPHPIPNNMSIIKPRNFALLLGFDTIQTLFSQPPFLHKAQGNSVSEFREAPNQEEKPAH